VALPWSKFAFMPKDLVFSDGTALNDSKHQRRMLGSLFVSEDQVPLDYPCDIKKQVNMVLIFVSFVLMTLDFSIGEIGVLLMSYTRIITHCFIQSGSSSNHVVLFCMVHCGKLLDFE
jgi:hypothetical protein